MSEMDCESGSSCWF